MGGAGLLPGSLGETCSSWGEYESEDTSRSERDRESRARRPTISNCEQNEKVLVEGGLKRNRQGGGGEEVWSPD